MREEEEPDKEQADVWVEATGVWLSVMVQPGGAALVWTPRASWVTCEGLFLLLFFCVCAALFSFATMPAFHDGSLSCLWESWDWLRPGFTGDLRGRYQVNAGSFSFSSSLSCSIAPAESSEPLLLPLANLLQPEDLTDSRLTGETEASCGGFLSETEPIARPPFRFMNAALEAWQPGSHYPEFHSAGDGNLWDVKDPCLYFEGLRQ